ncbi:MAG: hypothetical protein AAF493_15685 [Pseudomonadota bacterium]
MGESTGEEAFRSGLEQQLGRSLSDCEYAAHAQRLRRKQRAVERMRRWETDLMVTEPATLGTLLEPWATSR